VSIKPLSVSTLTPLLTRIDDARDGQICSLRLLSSSTLQIVFSVQDVARGYDWIEIVFQVNGVTDAKLVSDAVLSSLDMSEGITVELGSHYCALGIGAYRGRVHEAPLYILGTSLGYQERPFGG